MKTIRELYPELDEEYWYTWGTSYKDLVKGFEYAFLLWNDDDDYQGDSRVLLFDEKTDHFGVLTFGWGSCSGCDRLQACSTLEDLEALYTSLYDAIQWFDDAYTLYTFFSTHDWEGDYGHSQLFNECVLTISSSIYHHEQGFTIKQSVLDDIQRWEQEANN